VEAEGVVLTACLFSRVGQAVPCCELSICFMVLARLLQLRCWCMSAMPVACSQPPLNFVILVYFVAEISWNILAATAAAVFVLLQVAVQQ
jgi:hypothetical protein